MRLIGHLPNESQARRFSDYMLVLNLDTEVEPEGDGRWAVWVIDDEHLDDAGIELNAFRADPIAAKYQAAGRQAEESREARRRERESNQKRYHDRESLRPISIFQRAGTGTTILVIVSVAVFLVMLVNEPLVRQWLSIVKLTPEGGDTVSYSRVFLDDVRHGQLWRLFTPMFIHFDVLHIFFNMWLLIDLGGALERRYGSWRMLLFVLVVSACSNLLEYRYSSPMFGGMSGVVFALFGFVLVQSIYNPFSGFRVSPLMTALLLCLFVYSIVFDSGKIANYVHWGGLASGAVIGYLSALYSLKRPNTPR